MLRATIGDEWANDFERRAAKTRLVNMLVCLRVGGDLTQKDLAKKLGRSQAWVSKIEHSGDAAMMSQTQWKVATATGTDFHVIRPWRDRQDPCPCKVRPGRLSASRDADIP